MAHQQGREPQHPFRWQQHRRGLSLRAHWVLEGPSLRCHQYLQERHHNWDCSGFPSAEETMRAAARQGDGSQGHCGCHRCQEGRCPHLCRQGRLHLVRHSRQRGRSLQRAHSRRSAAHRSSWLRYCQARSGCCRHGEGSRCRRSFRAEHMPAVRSSP